MQGGRRRPASRCCSGLAQLRFDDVARLGFAGVCAIARRVSKLLLDDVTLLGFARIGAVRIRRGGKREAGNSGESKCGDGAFMFSFLSSWLS